jgi:hypothetical protein
MDHIQYIWQHHLFASFALYSVQNICTNSHANIHFLIPANILLQNIRLEANIRKTFSEFLIQANIC